MKRIFMKKFVRGHAIAWFHVLSVRDLIGMAQNCNLSGIDQKLVDVRSTEVEQVLKSMKQHKSAQELDQQISNFI